MKQLLAAVTLLAIVASSWSESKEEQTVAFVQKLQTTEGGFLATAKDKDAKPSLRATSSALRALKYFGGKPSDAAACAKFVEKCFDKTTGGFADAPGGQPDVTTTAIGLMAAVELKMPLDNFRDAAVQYLATNARTFEEIRIAAAGLEAVEKRPKVAEGWIVLVARIRNDDGTFGKDDGQARDTGGAVVVLLRLGGKIEHQDNVVKAVKAGQRKDGGFGKAGTESSDLETSYRIMRMFHMLKEKPADVEALKKFIAECRNDDGGYGVAPGQASSASGTYFASIILHWLED